MSGQLDSYQVNNLEDPLNESFFIENLLIDIPEMKSPSSLIEIDHRKQFLNSNVTVSQRIEGLLNQTNQDEQNVSVSSKNYLSKKWLTEMSKKNNILVVKLIKPV